MFHDPRDRRFYALKKRDPSQLSASEIKELMKYCDKLLEGDIEKKAGRSWQAYRAELSERLDRSS